MLTDLQKRKITRFFNLWDADGNGVLTTKDAEQMARNLAGLRGWNPGSPEYEGFYSGYMLYQNDFLQAVDLDENGEVSLEEWLAYHEEMLQDEARFEGTALMVSGLMFDLMDRDEEGIITLEDYRSWMGAVQIGEEDITEEVFQKLDLSGDGTLSKEELLQLTRQFFYSDDPEVPGNWMLGPV